MQQLREWFTQHQRHLPWRVDRTPYRVWISEVMLQQTRAAVVVPYFSRWMETFPTLPSVAAAPLEMVVKMWEGLGYYSRARNVHAAARLIVTKYQGNFPQEKGELADLPGFGPYTVGALLSFAFHQKAPAVDGNVVRFLSRFLGSTAVDRRYFEAATLNLLQDDEPWVMMEAMIELGAEICQPTPRCPKCPLQTKCRAYLEGKSDRLPMKKKGPPMTYLHRKVAVIESGEEILVRQEKEKKIMEGLYEFPHVPWDEEWSLGLEMVQLRQLLLVKHTYTRYHVTLHPAVYTVKVKQRVDGFEWRERRDLDSLPFSSGHRRIKNAYFTH